MAEDYYTRTTEKSASQMAKTAIYWSAGARLLLYLALSTGLIVLIWRGWPFAENTRLLVPAGLLVFPFSLTVLVERSLAQTPIKRHWRYRLAFLAGGAGLPALWMLRQLGAGTSTWTWSYLGGLLACNLGAFAAGLLTSGLQEGFWEDNLPPTRLVAAEVYRRHQARLPVLAPTPWSKRLFDLSLAVTGLLISTPVWLAGSFLIWFEDPGPVLFVKNSVGKGGRNFRQYKLRTMVRGAENETGPVMAQIGDQRVLRFGRFMRKTALDELPQLINILAGQMSFVGPRPQRTVLVLGYLQETPEYAERHRVLPGLAGLAQVAGDYFLSPRQKLRFDCLYIRYSSLAFDLKLIGLAFLIAFWFRWQKGWNGRIPRRLLHGSRPRARASYSALPD